MFMVRSPQLRSYVETLDDWRTAARLVSTRWEAFREAEPKMRTFAFAAYLSALDSEAAAAADLSALAPRTAAGLPG
jgi:hypothetical protein